MTLRAHRAENDPPPDHDPGRGPAGRTTIATTPPAPGGRRFYLDLHSHSTDASDDAGGTVEGYLKWIAARRKRGYHVDGFVLTEHRAYDPTVDYSQLADRYETVVLRGAELETTVGHVLVYNITPDFAHHFDFSAVNLPPHDVFRVARETGGFAVAAHAGRPSIGVAEHAANGFELGNITAIEQLNGGSSDAENSLAADFAARHGLNCVGGSDAHFVSAIGRCLTAFARPIATLEDLVEELASGDYHPVTIEQTLDEGARP